MSHIYNIYKYLYKDNNKLNKNYMPRIDWSRRSDDYVVSKAEKSTREKAKLVAASPFPAKTDTVNREITINLKDGIKEYKISGSKEIIGLDSFTNVMQNIINCSPIWRNKSPHYADILLYIIGTIEMDTNKIKISEEECCATMNISRDKFYKGINALLRDKVDHPVSGDRFALLAATNKKSIYIVNHNLIFRGNYNNFISIFNTKLEVGFKLDSNGKVIL